MNSIAIIISAVLLIWPQLALAEILPSTFFGTITKEADCHYFNENPDLTIARAKAFSNASTWKIAGETAFPVSDCYKTLTDPRKKILFSIDGDYGKLKSFPRGPGWMQVPVVRGPNVETTPAKIPSPLEDGAFEKVIFSFAESETGLETRYTSGQMEQMIAAMKSIEGRGATRFLQLNSVLINRTPKSTFKGFTDELPAGIVIYQEQKAEEETAVVVEGIVDRLGVDSESLLFDVGARRVDNIPQALEFFDEGDSETTVHPITTTKHPQSSDKTGHTSHHTGHTDHSGSTESDEPEPHSKPTILPNGALGLRPTAAFLTIGALSMGIF